MPQVCHNTKEVRFKIAITGAAGSGKASVLQHLNRRLDPYLRTELRKASRTRPELQLDFLPIHSQEIPGYRSRFQLVTASSCPPAHAVWSGLLENCDGQMYVADSSHARFEANRHAFWNFQLRFSSSGIEPRPLPTVFLYNKQDLAGKTAPEHLDELFRACSPAYLTCAISGHQIFASLDYLIDRITTRFRATGATPKPHTAEPFLVSRQLTPPRMREKSTVHHIGN